jgi:hypothetical protein
MPKNNKSDLFVSEIGDEKIIDKAIKPVEVVKEEKKYYDSLLWMGVNPVFRCLNCDYQNPDEGEVILHIVKHVPEKERDALLDKLVSKMTNKEKK